MSKSSKSQCNIYLYAIVAIVFFYFIKSFMHPNERVSSSSSRGQRFCDPSMAGNGNKAQLLENCMKKSQVYPYDLTSPVSARERSDRTANCIMSSKKKRSCPSKRLLIRQ